MGLKVHIERAYYCMNWSFTKLVLKRYGFNQKFVRWIVGCANDSSFPILINGFLAEMVFIYHRLAQGMSFITLLIYISFRDLSQDIK